MNFIRSFWDPRRASHRRVSLAWGLAAGLFTLGSIASVGAYVAGVLAAIAISLAIGLPTYFLLEAQGDARQEARDLWALTGIMLDGRPWPAPGGWALSAGALIALMKEIDVRRLHTVVELGPGASSIILSRGVPNVKMYGLEHDERFIESLSSELKLHGLTDYQLIHAPLVRCAGGGAWYSVDALDEIPDNIDVLIVDGPPNWGGDGNRSHAWPMLRNKLASSAVILVDDTSRLYERSMIERWVTEGGLSILRDYGSFVMLIAD